MPQLEEEDKKPEVVIEELLHLRGDHYHQRQIKKCKIKKIIIIVQKVILMIPTCSYLIFLMMISRPWPRP